MLAQELSLDSSQVAESQGTISQLRVEVTGMYLNPTFLTRWCLDKYLISSSVLRAQNVPHTKKRFGLKRQFFVTVTNHATIKKTESVQADAQTVQWNQTLGAL